MIRHGVSALIVLVNASQVLAAAILDVHSIWFDRYELRNVGPGVIYAAYALIIILLAQVANGALWIAVRKNRAESRAVAVWALGGFLAMLLFMWLGERFMYAGTR